MERGRVTRREVVAGAAALAGLAACAAPRDPADAAATLSAADPSSPPQYPIAKVGDVAVGSVLAFNNPADGMPAFLMQPSAGTYVAYLAICTHEGCVVEHSADKRMFFCPCHGANYDEGGSVTRGPAKEPLKQLGVSVVGDDIVLLAL